MKEEKWDKSDLHDKEVINDLLTAMHFSQETNLLTGEGRYTTKELLGLKAVKPYYEKYLKLPINEQVLFETSKRELSKDEQKIADELKEIEFFLLFGSSSKGRVSSLIEQINSMFESRNDENKDVK